MRISYRLTAFDRQTDEWIESQVVPAELVSAIRKVAKIPPSDDGTGDYPLDTVQVHKIAKILGMTFDPKSLDYFIEPYAEESGAAPLKTAGG